MLRRVFDRALAAVILLAGVTACVLVFLIGAPVAAGVAFQEPVETVCYDPWLKSHPLDYEPNLDGTWSWWPPGVTCTHSSGEVFVEPSASDAAAVAGFGFVVLIFGIVPTLMVTRSIQRLGIPRMSHAAAYAAAALTTTVLVGFIAYGLALLAGAIGWLGPAAVVVVTALAVTSWAR